MINISEKPIVALIKNESVYPNNFLPDRIYPEFKEISIHRETNPDNKIFQSVRELFKLLKYDEDNIGSSFWNPLSEIIEPGNTVLIKPNFVLDKSKCKDITLEVLITHPSLIVAVIDYVILALKGNGTIIIGDAPIQEAKFEEMIGYLNFFDYVNDYRKKTDIKFEIIDFRKERSINKIYREIQRIELSGDPRGYCRVELNEKSAMKEITHQYKQFRVTNYNKEKMLNFHKENYHSYLITKSALESDVIISMPKLKSHRKAGITCAMKNLVGINGTKDCLPHHRKGSLVENGDEYPKKSFRKKLLSNLEENRAQSKSKLYCFMIFLFKLVLYFFERIFPYKDPIKEGNWYGNITLPRMILDINYIINFASKEGKIADLNRKRKLFALTDAIISGEKDGPLCPTKKATGFILASQDFLANDIISCIIAGFDPLKISTITFALKSQINVNNITTIDNIEIVSNIQEFSDIQSLKLNNKIRFEPTIGWKGHIELE